MKLEFPKIFIWGCASAAYQIEGAPAEDGKGPSIWDVFSHKPGAIAGGFTGDVACDAYHHLDEDLDLMQTLGIPNYRFSVSWPRVLPEGTGEINEAGLAYYDRLVDGCLVRGIVPWITLYHWDLPQALQDRGGWEVRETAEAFAAFSRIIADHFRGRVRHIMTINEPQIIVGLGYGIGLHAPGLKLPADRMFGCWHNVMLAHGLATKEIRESSADYQIGLSSTGALGYITEHTETTPAPLAEFSFHTMKPDEPAEPSSYCWFNHQWFLDPVCLGHYPDDPDSPWAACAEKVSASDLELIHQVPDFIGMNIYNGTELDPQNGYAPAPKYPGYPRTSLKWPVTPEVMYWGCRQVHERYGLPICVTENGQSCHDRIFLDGKVHDPDRIDLLQRYLGELSAACADGIPVLGYFHWSFTDNLEWHSGYDDRFGLVFVDYRDQRRIPKDSAWWYSDLIRSQDRL